MEPQEEGKLSELGCCRNRPTIVTKEQEEQSAKGNQAAIETGTVITKETGQPKEQCNNTSVETRQQGNY